MDLPESLPRNLKNEDLEHYTNFTEKGVTIMSLTIAFFLKGVAWFIAHSAPSTLAHIGSYIISHGAITTATAILTNPVFFASAVVVGGVVWTSEKIQAGRKVIEAIKDGEAIEAGAALVEFADLANIGIDAAADQIVDLLKEHCDIKDIVDVSKAIKDIAVDVNKMRNDNA